MPLRLLFPISRTPCTNRRIFSARRVKSQMGVENLSLIQKTKHASFRLINVSGFKTDLLEIHSQEQKLHVLFIPGNPGIGHIAHSEKDWESGRLFSLQEQISHKRSFIEQELEDVQVPIVLVGHSIGAYISLEIFRRYHEKVIYCIGLYPFLALNAESSTQSSIKGLAASSALCAAVSSMGPLLGMLPVYISRFLVKESMGKSWSFSTVDAMHPCSPVSYNPNILFMAMTEFQEMPEKPDWDFLRRKKSQVAFVLALMITGSHAFIRREAGSLWVAQHVSSLIKNNIENAKSI
ncbi:hypothetical protein DH2020_039774 [Rehmannia glutinosa]|uniref:Uncharacterized protein n=1 Tax=Rehmannia glutinosa TaxID=99300 RepID=A0ABR0UUU0_REHGL